MKTTNNANLNKLMAKKANKVVVESMDKLQDDRGSEVLESVYNGTCDLRTLLNITKEEIDDIFESIKKDNKKKGE